jgi:hypothetical protein
MLRIGMYETVRMKQKYKAGENICLKSDANGKTKSTRGSPYWRLGGNRMSNEGIIREKRKLCNGRVIVAIQCESRTMAEVFCLNNLCSIRTCLCKGTDFL